MSLFHKLQSFAINDEYDSNYYLLQFYFFSIFPKLSKMDLRLFFCERQSASLLQSAEEQPQALVEGKAFIT